MRCYLTFMRLSFWVNLNTAEDNRCHHKTSTRYWHLMPLHGWLQLWYIEKNGLSAITLV